MVRDPAFFLLAFVLEPRAGCSTNEHKDDLDVRCGVVRRSLCASIEEAERFASLLIADRLHCDLDGDDCDFGYGWLRTGGDGRLIIRMFEAR